jgi:hypothetical protein
MVETIIVRRGDRFETYSGWVVNRTSDSIVLAAIGGPDREPVATIIALSQIVAGQPVAA